jgi:glucose-6-phosphate isomerase
MNIDKATVNKLVFSARKTNINARICLHPDPGALFHSMVVVEHRGSYFPPHRHGPAKAESLHIIRGDLAVFIFDDNGQVTNKMVLAHHGDPFLAYIPGHAWHLTAPASKLVVYHESKPGPFLGEADREFAPWAPARDHPGAADYVKQLLV